MKANAQNQPSSPEIPRSEMLQSEISRPPPPPERTPPRTQGDERRHERSITPYRRKFAYRSSPYRSPSDFRERDERSRSGTPWPVESKDSSLNEGKYNLLQKFGRYFFNQLSVNFF